MLSGPPSFREELEDETSNVKSLAGALLVCGFLTSVVYVASVGLELTMAHLILSRKG